MKSNWILILITMFVTVCMTYADWPMSAHDPQRTSWASEDTIGDCGNAVWYNSIHALIPTRAHIITVESLDTVYAPAADGVHALDPNSGLEKWHYQMDLPVGDSPTIAGNVMYVCGTDKTIHAVNAATGVKIWQTDRAGAAFYCNPVVAGGKVYAGSLDGYFYCFNASDGNLDWYYEVGEPIMYSAAYQTYTDYPDGVIFFVAKDCRAYALRADNGGFLWQSPKLHAHKFSGFWPVIIGDRVIFVSCPNYPVGGADMIQMQKNEICLATMAEILARVDAGGWLDLQYHQDHLATHPWRKTVFILDRKTGQEAETTPILFWGNPCGNRYPVAVGPNPTGSGPTELVWGSTPWLGMDAWFTAGRYAGWNIGTPRVRTVPSVDGALEAGDEPEAHSIIGDNYLYYNRGGDGRDAGGRFFLDGGGGDLWGAWTFNALGDYSVDWEYRRYGNPKDPSANYQYGSHGHQNPPVPLKGKVYFHRSNAVICMGT